MNIDAFVPHIWTILAAVGSVLAIMSLIESAVDFMTTRPTNGFRMLAIGDIAQESIRLVMYVAFGVLGVWALLNDRGRDGGPVWVLVAGLFLLVVKTIIQIMVRRYLRATHGRVAGAPETQNQREDREMGDRRRVIEQEHIDDRV